MGKKLVDTCNDVRRGPLEVNNDMFFSSQDPDQWLIILIHDPDLSLGSLPWHLQPDQVDQGQQCFLQEELHLGFSTPAIQVKIYTDCNLT